MSQSGKIQDAQAGDGSMCPSQCRDVQVVLLALQRGCSCGDVLSGHLNSKLVGYEQALQGKHGFGLALDSACSDMVWSGCSFPTKLMGLFSGS